ncbi:MAG: PPC domain-containing DNA-binding protein [Patescibacteria group bacterium]
MKDKNNFQTNRIHILKLNPNQDLKLSIKKYIKKNKIQAGIILTCVGSLKKATIRLAEENIKNFSEKFEIISLSGTLSPDGVHLHISLADKKGKIIGGHLKENCLINTTAEIIIMEILNFHFKRKHDKNTNYKELDFKKIK